MAKSRKKATSTAAPLGYEAQLWQMADALRGAMDAAEYKHVCLGRLSAEQAGESDRDGTRAGGVVVGGVGCGIDA